MARTIIIELPEDESNYQQVAYRVSAGLINAMQDGHPKSINAILAAASAVLACGVGTLNRERDCERVLRKHLRLMTATAKVVARGARKGEPDGQG